MLTLDRIKQICWEILSVTNSDESLSGFLFSAAHIAQTDSLISNYLLFLFLFQQERNKTFCSEYANKMITILAQFLASYLKEIHARVCIFPKLV